MRTAPRIPAPDHRRRRRSGKDPPCSRARRPDEQAIRRRSRRCGARFGDGGSAPGAGDPVGSRRRRRGAVPAEEQLVHVLARRRLLLVLDNCEHILEPVAGLAHQLLARCDTVTLLATSREVLSLPGEAVWQPLACRFRRRHSLSPATSTARTPRPSSSPGPARPSPASAPPPPTPPHCRHLPGSRRTAAGAGAGRRPGARARRCRDRRAPRRPLPAPHRRPPLLALPAPDAPGGDGVELRAPRTAGRQLLARLGVFPQSFDLAAATAVAGEAEDQLDVLDRLARLIDKSLVVPEGAAATARYRLLETVRQYAVEVLAATGEEAGARRRHRHHFVEWIERDFQPGDNLQQRLASRSRCRAGELLCRAGRCGGRQATGSRSSVLIAGFYGLWFWWSPSPRPWTVSIRRTALRRPFHAGRSPPRCLLGRLRHRSPRLEAALESSGGR